MAKITGKICEPTTKGGGTMRKQGYFCSISLDEIKTIWGETEDRIEITLNFGKDKVNAHFKKGENSTGSIRVFASKIKTNKVSQKFISQMLKHSGQEIEFRQHSSHNKKVFDVSLIGDDLNTPSSKISSPKKTSKKTLPPNQSQKKTRYPDEINRDTASQLSEGAKKQVIVNRYERNPQARKECIKKYGYTCSVCGFDFETNYGSIGKKFIHVHHLVDVAVLAKKGEKYSLDPIKDLRPVCPNCHAMLHREKPAMKIPELKKIFEQ